MFKKITDLDLRFFHFWRSHSFSNRTDAFLKFYIRLGDGYVWALVIAYIAVFEGFDKLIEMLKAVFPAVALSLAFYWIIKLSIRRKRPFNLLSDVKAEVPPLDKYSFPSGHTMNNLAVGFTLLYFMPHIGWIMILMPLTWGFLRVYYGVHWFSDVLAGVILAGLCFWGGLVISNL